MIHLLLVAARVAIREFRAGELSILIAALVIAVASSTTVSILGDRLSRTMNLQAAEFLAADLVVAGHQPAPPVWRIKASELGLRQAQTVEFSSVLVAGGEILLTAIKAVGDGYPLRGQLRISDQELGGDTNAGGIPEAGTAWVELRVLRELGLALGSRIDVGEKTFRVTRIVTREPDPRGDLYSLSPRVLINLADLDATRVIQPGSRVHHYQLIAGEEMQVRAFNTWLKPQLHPGQRILDVYEDRPEVGNALKRAQRYLSLTTVAVILIAGCAIATSVRRYTVRHYDLTAMLKCFGVTGRSIMHLYLFQFLLIGLATSAAGCLLGWSLQEIAGLLLRDLLPQRLAGPSGFAMLFGVLTGLLILFGFALPPLLRLRRCTPLRVLRRDIEPAPNRTATVYGFALAVLGILLWRATGDLRMTVIILVGSLAAIAVLALVARLILVLAHSQTGRLGLAARIALRSLDQGRMIAIGQVLAFGITFVAMLLTILVRTELVDEWKRQLPKDAPNHFALNLFETDRLRFGAFLDRENIRGSAFYPIVRGRLTKINGVDVWTRGYSGSMAESALNRDLSLTWSDQLPAENVLSKGRWWSDRATQTVSVEERLAGDLRLHLGDWLTFNIAGIERQARVASFRRVRWDTMMPNFFMIFSPGSLDDQPHTYLTSFYVPTEREDVLPRLARNFPAVSLLAVDRLLLQLQTILRQISGAVEYVLLFALAAGFTVLFAAVRASLDARLYSDAVLRALGAPSALLRRSLWIEFSGLGFVSGVMAAAVAEGIAWILFRHVFSLPTHWHPEFWLITPPCAALSIGLAGYLNTLAKLRKTPLTVLRDL